MAELDACHSYTCHGYMASASDAGSATATGQKKPMCFHKGLKSLFVLENCKTLRQVQIELTTEIVD